MDPTTLVIVGGVGIATAVALFGQCGSDKKKTKPAKTEKKKEQPQQQQQGDSKKVIKRGGWWRWRREWEMRWWHGLKPFLSLLIPHFFYILPLRPLPHQSQSKKATKIEVSESRGEE